MISKAVRNLGLGLAAGAAAALVIEALRPLGGREPMLDWDEVRRLARHRLGEEGIHPARLDLLANEYNRLAAEVRGPVLEALGGLPPEAALPDFKALDRPGWLDVNIGIMSKVMAPVVRASSFERTRLTALGKAGVNRYAAFLLAFLGRRVLGQFDPQLRGVGDLAAAEEESAAHSLYLVEPNVAAWEARADLDGTDLRRWLILHELTHAWQFAAHPWLRRYLDDMLARVIELSIGPERADPVRRLVQMTVGMPEQWRLVRRLQATMSLIEGHGNLVMNTVGRRVLPSYDRLEEAYRERSGTRSPIELLVWKVTGLELKMQQYQVGEAFARHIHDVYGMRALDRAWAGPDTLPAPEELRNPEAWYQRVIGNGGARAVSAASSG
jgi:coenzyme F420 biosynthesis associated uncharacterized protein